MELNTQDWKEFVIGKILECNTTVLSIKDVLEDGTVPFISRTAVNNGCDGYVDVDKSAITKGDCLTIGAEGIYSFYQPEDFATGNKVYTLRNDLLNVYHYMFISTILNKEDYKYSYGRARIKSKLEEEIVKLPVLYNSDGTIKFDLNKTYSDEGYIPDWQFMEDYIKSLHHKPITTKVKVGNIKDLEIDKWEEFTVSKLFNRIYKAKAHTKEEVEEVEKGIHFVSRTDINNGVDTSVDDTVRYEGLEEPNCITIGDTTATCFYQNERFIAGDHMVVLRADWLNLKRGLFFRTLFAQEGIRYCYGRAYRMDLIKSTKLKLPIQRDNNGNPIIDASHAYSDDGFIPDWQFMEDYINSLPYSDRI